MTQPIRQEVNLWVNQEEASRQFNAMMANWDNITDKQKAEWEKKFGSGNVTQTVKTVFEVDDSGFKNAKREVTQVYDVLDATRKQWVQNNKLAGDSATSLRQQVNQAKQVRDELSKFKTSLDSYGRIVKTINNDWAEQNQRVQALQRVLGEVSSGGFFDNIKNTFRDTGLSQFSQGIQGLVGTFQSVAIVVQQITAAFNALTGSLKQIQGLELTFKSIGQGAEGGARAFSEAARISTSLGVSLNSTLTSFQKLTPVITATGGSISDVSSITEALSSRFAAFGLSADASNRVMNAVVQAFGKGTLQAEELNQQISEADPAFRTDLANAIGVSVAQLSKMVEAGEITTDVLKKAIPDMGKVSSLFNMMGMSAGDAARALFDKVGPTLEQVTNKINAMNQLSFIELSGQFNKLVESIFVIQGATADLFASFSKSETLKLLAGAIGSIVSAFANMYNMITSITGTFVSLIDPVAGLVNSFTSLSVAGVSVGSVLGGIMAIGIVGYLASVAQTAMQVTAAIAAKAQAYLVEKGIIEANKAATLGAAAAEGVETAAKNANTLASEANTGAKAANTTAEGANALSSQVEAAADAESAVAKGLDTTATLANTGATTANSVANAANAGTRTGLLATLAAGIASKSAETAAWLANTAATSTNTLVTIAATAAKGALAVATGLLTGALKLLAATLAFMASPLGVVIAAVVMFGVALNSAKQMSKEADKATADYAKRNAELDQILSGTKNSVDGLNEKIYTNKERWEGAANRIGGFEAALDRLRRSIGLTSAETASYQQELLAVDQGFDKLYQKLSQGVTGFQQLTAGIQGNAQATAVAQERYNQIVGAINSEINALQQRKTQLEANAAGDAKEEEARQRIITGIQLKITAMEGLKAKYDQQAQASGLAVVNTQKENETLQQQLETMKQQVAIIEMVNQKKIEALTEAYEKQKAIMEQEKADMEAKQENEKQALEDMKIAKQNARDEEKMALEDEKIAIEQKYDAQLKNLEKLRAANKAYYDEELARLKDPTASEQALSLLKVEELKVKAAQGKTAEERLQAQAQLERMANDEKAAKLEKQRQADEKAFAAEEKRIQEEKEKALADLKEKERKEDRAWQEEMKKMAAEQLKMQRDQAKEKKDMAEKEKQKEREFAEEKKKLEKEIADAKDTTKRFEMGVKEAVDGTARSMDAAKRQQDNITLAVKQTILQYDGPNGLIAKANAYATALSRAKAPPTPNPPPPPPKFAGGPVSAGELFTVNEFGKEAFLSNSGKLSWINKSPWSEWRPPSSGTIIPAHIASGMNIPAGGVNVNGSVATRVQAAVPSGGLSGRMERVLRGAIIGSGGTINNTVTIESSQPVQASDMLVELTKLKRRRYS
jgi:tape measure domain-containing protein